MDLERLKLLGYCIVSRRHRLAARIDREDWKEVLAAGHVNGMDWVNNMVKHRYAADHYRRCYAKHIEVPESFIKLLLNSGDPKTPQEYMPSIKKRKQRILLLEKT